MTDGTAAAVASGASAIGDGEHDASGTTLVWKLVAARPVVDPQGRLYCHRHPGGAFLPGGAGNAGGEGIAHQVLARRSRAGGRTSTGWPRRSPTRRPRAARLSAAASPASVSPSSTRASPVSPTRARAPRQQRYRAALEGLACIERWGYEVAAGLGRAGRRRRCGPPASARATRAGCSCAPTSSAARCAAPCTPNPASAPRWSRR